MRKGMKGPFNFVGGTGKVYGYFRVKTPGSYGLPCAPWPERFSDDSFQQVAAGLAVWAQA